MPFLSGLKEATNVAYTEKGAKVKATTNSNLLDLFSKIGSVRGRTESDIIRMFNKAYAEDKLIALKTLFYSRDVRGGQGERDTFRTIIKHLAEIDPKTLKRNLHLIPEYGRWDDLLALLDTPLEDHVVEIIRDQLQEDYACETPSLLAKWLPSENSGVTSTKKRKRLAKAVGKNPSLRSNPEVVCKLRTYDENVVSSSKVVATKLIRLLGATPKEYRQALSHIRKKINLIETAMSNSAWDTIDFSKVTSKASMQYRRAFHRNCGGRYEDFLDDLAEGKTKVNASTLYPYEIVNKVLDAYGAVDTSNRKLYNGMWEALPDYVGGSSENAIAVVDVSGSMRGRPMEVAISLGLYLAERSEGEFKNHFITFSSDPKLVEVAGTDFCSKVANMSREDWGMSTNLEATFDLILDVAIGKKLTQDELPKRLFIITDMEFDAAVRTGNNFGWGYFHVDCQSSEITLMQAIREKYVAAGYEMPELVFWNVDSRNDHSPMSMDERGFQVVSGLSPSIFKHTLAGTFLSAYDLMLDVVGGERYAAITL